MDTFGKKFRVTIFGESHGDAIGAVIDGIPAGIEISEGDFSADISKRRSGAKGTTPRIEADEPVILSGVFNGHTTGGSLAVMFRNTNTRSSDYSSLLVHPRPGHADFVAGIKWNGYNDYRGGGHFSGRLTLPVVAAGVIAKKILAEKLSRTVSVSARIVEIGGIATDIKDLASIPENVAAAIESAAEEGDSIGGIVECRVSGLPVGIGEPFFDSVESMVSHAVFSIPGVRGIEFGDGFKAAAMKGSQHNDPIADMGGRTVTNHAGGINGGITNGNPVVFRVAFKPTASIRKEQITLNTTTGNMESLVVPGRHDVCFALRTPVIVEAMTAIAITDLLA